MQLQATQDFVQTDGNHILSKSSRYFWANLTDFLVFDRDVSGVELLLNNHQGLKAEIDSRDENFTICVNLGRELLARKHERSKEVLNA